MKNICSMTEATRLVDRSVTRNSVNIAVMTVTDQNVHFLHALDRVHQTVGIRTI